MIDHVAFYVSDLERSRGFYEQALAPIGYGLAFELEDMVAFGPESYPRSAVRVGKEPCTTGHVAFTVDERATVDAFFSAGMAAGGTENGPPACASTTHPTDYAASVGDPDGNNVEVVGHAPAWAEARREEER